jgi:hypothetical protein
MLSQTKVNTAADSRTSSAGLLFPPSCLLGPGSVKLVIDISCLNFHMNACICVQIYAHANAHAHARIVGMISICRQVAREFSHSLSVRLPITHAHTNKLTNSSSLLLHRQGRRLAKVQVCFSNPTDHEANLCSISETVSGGSRPPPHGSASQSRSQRPQATRGCARRQ